MTDLIRCIPGDIVITRDGKHIKVTDANTDLNTHLYTISREAYVQRGQEVITSSIPNETIFIGTRVWGGVSTTTGDWEPVRRGGQIITDMSEIVDWLKVK